MIEAVGYGALPIPSCVAPAPRRAAADAAPEPCSSESLATMGLAVALASVGLLFSRRRRRGAEATDP